MKKLSNLKPSTKDNIFFATILILAVISGVFFYDVKNMLGFKFTLLCLLLVYIVIAYILRLLLKP